MADLYPNAAGSWSTTTNWFNAATGLTVNRVPTTGDNVWLNNKTITLDTNATCDKLSNKPFTGAVFSPVVGGSVTVALSNVFCPTITVGSGGIETTTATTAANVISVSGSVTNANIFQILCTGDITGGFNTTANAINLLCTGTKVQINANNITGGTGGAAVYVNSTGNSIYINCTSTISGNTYQAILGGISFTTGSFYIKATTILAGTSISAILLSANNTGTQYIGYTYDFTTPTASAVTNITASASYPAIQSYTGAAPYSNTTPFLINATNVNSNVNGYFPIQVFNLKLNDTATLNIPNLSGVLKAFVVGATPPIAASDVWNYLTANATTAGSLGKLIVDNLNATVSSRLATSGYTAPDNSSITAIKAKTDNLPSDPASNTQVNTRLASASYTAPDNATISTINTNVSAIKTKTDNLPANTGTQLTTIQTATDRIPTNPASVQSTGDQIATLQ